MRLLVPLPLKRLPHSRPQPPTGTPPNLRLVLAGISSTRPSQTSQRMCTSDNGVTSFPANRDAPATHIKVSVAQMAQGQGKWGFDLLGLAEASRGMRRNFSASE